MINWFIRKFRKPETYTVLIDKYLFITKTRRTNNVRATGIVYGKLQEVHSYFYLTRTQLGGVIPL